ncbi:MAG: hypothetical protein CMJ75_05670 [Planctomycetaceae bacterium]|nr:hypothetical protein [Planctomycetaceae bacterium]
MNPIIYILIEIAERELDSKLLTALYLVKKGFHVIVGYQWALSENRDCLPVGTFFFKGMNKIHTDNMARVRRFGHAVVAMEEELLGLCGYPPGDDNFREVFHTDANHHCQLFLASHEFEVKVVKKIMPDLNVRLTGNPRTDCLRPELVSMYDSVMEEISEVLASGYILINTNLGYLNSRLSSKIESSVEKKVVPEDQEFARRYNEQKGSYIKWERYDMKSTFKLIQLFGQHDPNQKILIRPHPRESLDTYTRFSRKYPNVEVANNQNSARPWILASDILVHTGCTTGAEAVAMGHPTISIQGKDSDFVQYRTTNQVSYLANTAEEAYQAVQEFYAGKLKLGNPSKLTGFWPAQAGEFASEKISNEIHDFYLSIGGLFTDFKLTFSSPFKQIRLTDFHKNKMLVELSVVEEVLKRIYQNLPAMPQMKLYEICRNVFYLRPL